MGRNWLSVGCLSLALLGAMVPCAHAEPTVGRAWTRAFYLDNLAGDFLSFQARHASASLDEQLNAFRREFEPTHLKVLESGPWRDSQREAFYREGLANMLHELAEQPQLATGLRRRQRQFELAIPRLANRLQTCFQPGELRLDRPFVLGLDFGTRLPELGRLHGRNTLILPINRMQPELPLDIYLGTQMFRLLHADLLEGRGQALSNEIGLVAFREGAARYFANEQLPGFTDREVLGYSFGEWRLAIAQQRDLAYDLLHYFNSTDSFWTNKFLSEAPADGQTLPRAATYVGYLAVQRLRRHHSWDEIIRWKDEEVQTMLEKALGVF